MISTGESEDKIIEIILLLKEIFSKENLFLEITAQDESVLNEVKKINDNILTFSKKTNIECIINNNYFYINKEDKEAWEMALAIRD
jgi:DNA polymerase III alpha subunit